MGKIQAPRDPNSCGATQLLGSRVAFANVALRFPLVRRFALAEFGLEHKTVAGDHALSSDNAEDYLDH